MNYMGQSIGSPRSSAANQQSSQIDHSIELFNRMWTQKDEDQINLYRSSGNSKTSNRLSDSVHDPFQSSRFSRKYKSYKVKTNYDSQLVHSVSSPKQKNVEKKSPEKKKSSNDISFADENMEFEIEQGNFSDIQCLKKMNTESEALQNYRNLYQKRKTTLESPFQPTYNVQNFPSVEELQEEYSESSPFFKPMQHKFEINNYKKLNEELV